MKKRRFLSCVFAGLILFNSATFYSVAKAETLSEEQANVKSKDDFDANIVSKIKHYVNGEPRYVEYCKDSLCDENGNVNMQMQLLDILDDFDLIQALDTKRRNDLQYTEVSNILLEIAKEEESKGFTEAYNTATDNTKNITNALDNSSYSFKFGELLDELDNQDVSDLYDELKTNDNTNYNDILNKYFTNSSIKKKFEKYFENTDRNAILELQKIAKSSRDINTFREKSKKIIFA